MFKRNTPFLPIDFEAIHPYSGPSKLEPRHIHQAIETESKALGEMNGARYDDRTGYISGAIALGCASIAGMTVENASTSGIVFAALPASGITIAIAAYYFNEAKVRRENGLSLHHKALRLLGIAATDPHTSA